DGLRPAARGVAGIFSDGRCKNIAPEVAKIIGETYYMQGTGVRLSALASLQVIAGDIYKNIGYGTDALTHYKRVDELRPSTASALRIANLFLGAGEYEQARKALEIA